MYIYTLYAVRCTGPQTVGVVGPAYIHIHVHVVSCPDPPSGGCGETHQNVVSCPDPPSGGCGETHQKGSGHETNVHVQYSTCHYEYMRYAYCISFVPRPVPSFWWVWPPSGVSPRPHPPEGLAIGYRICCAGHETNTVCM